jgi:hypothetical protein
VIGPPFLIDSMFPFGFRPMQAFQTRNVKRLAFLIGSALSMGGCGSGESSGLRPSGPVVRLIYEGQPQGGIEVRLYADAKDFADSDQPVYIGLSDSAGEAVLLPLPGIAGIAVDIGEKDWAVGLRSIGEGDWILDPRLGDPAKSRLTVRPAAVGDGDGDTGEATVQIPRGAIRPL